LTEARVVSCSRCGETAPGLAKPPLAGEVGQQVFDHTCQQCWAEWFEQSVLVINHYGLNPALREDRLRLYEVMREFLALSPPA
jgi:Fe-S cluster biosynthesis and repair protein YggX